MTFSGCFLGGSYVYIAFFSVKNDQKSDFRPKNALFRSNMGLLSSKLGHKNGNGEFFAAAEPNNNSVRLIWSKNAQKCFKMGQNLNKNLTLTMVKKGIGKLISLFLEGERPMLGGSSNE